MKHQSLITKLSLIDDLFIFLIIDSQLLVVIASFMEESRYIKGGSAHCATSSKNVKVCQSDEKSVPVRRIVYQSNVKSVLVPECHVIKKT